MERILDFASGPVAVQDIEAVVRLAYHGSDSRTVMEASEVLAAFVKHPEAYTQVDRLLSESKMPEALFFGLTVLDDCILGRWNVLPEEQQRGIKDFIIGFIMERCTSVQEMRQKQNRMVLNKANATLVSVAKREWPHRWPGFIDEVVGSAGCSRELAENAICILEMLVEEVFEYGGKTMTSRWIDRKRRALAQYFEQVWDLCCGLLGCDDTYLLNRSLSCLAAYVPYVGAHLSVNEGFLAGITAFLDNAATRCTALQVLTEVAQVTVPPPTSGNELQRLFSEAMRRIVAWMPRGPEDIAAKVQVLYVTGTDEDERFVDAVCIFISKFLPKHLTSLQPQTREALLAAHEIIVGILRVADNSKDIFKTALEYCWWLGDFIVHPRHGLQGTAAQIRKVLDGALRNIRLCCIQKMAKPEEVIVVEDENGELQSQYMTDVQTISLYTQMRELLVYLTHIDPRETDDTIRRLMSKQVDGSDWGWSKLNALCWAYGSLSGAFDVDAEKSSFVSFLRDLLLMCERATEKNDRAILASNVMYVAGQYPRFLRSHGRFLLTLVKKNIDFMREEFPGVRDMAVDTLVRVMRHCADVLWQESDGTAARNILSSVDSYVADLNHAQTHTLYEALGYLVKSCPGSGDQAILILLQSPNVIWFDIAATANSAGPSAVVNTDTLRSMIHVLRCFNRTATTCGTPFIFEMRVIFDSLQTMYTLCSEVHSSLLRDNGPNAMMLQTAKLLRTVKKEILKTVEEFIANTDEIQFVAQEVVPHLFNTFLSDYEVCFAHARDPHVLAVITAGVKRLQGHLSDGTGRILSAVFNPTVELITQNAEDYPEHRVNLFALLRALNKECFSTFIQYAAQNLEVVYGLIWASKHIDRNTCFAGLDTLIEIIRRITLESDEAADMFFATFCHQIVTDTLVAMLDTLHRPAFQKQVSLLGLIFQYSSSYRENDQAPYSQSNLSAYLASQLAELPTLTHEQIDTFVAACFSKAGDRLELLRLFADLMVEVQVWGAEQENQDALEEERRLREAAIVGFARPDDRARYSAMLDDEASFVV